MAENVELRRKWPWPVLKYCPIICEEQCRRSTRTSDTISDLGVTNQIEELQNMRQER
jgi:hypothetical protein